MRLEHEFTVPVPADDAWRILLDLPEIAPCMPGATLTSYDGADFTGTVKVKLGPISLTYKGKGRIVEQDKAARRAVVEASGRESRGSGTAKATVTASLCPESDRRTRVEVATDLAITGRPAQFGRGMMTDVGSKLIGQFAQCLAGKLERGEVAGTRAAGEDGETPGKSADSGTPTEPRSPSTPSTPASSFTPSAPASSSPMPVGPQEARARRASGVPDPRTEPEPTSVQEPIDLLKLTGGARLAKYAGVFVAGLALGWVLSRVGGG